MMSDLSSRRMSPLQAKRGNYREHLSQSRTAITTGIKLITVNLLRVLLILALLANGYNDLIVQHTSNSNPLQPLQASAARLRGVIYNKDGKFIYRPSRASQAHIIIIDDRAPRGKQQASSTSQQQELQPLDDWATTHNRSSDQQQQQHAIAASSEVLASQSPSLIQFLTTPTALARHQQQQPQQLLSHPIARIATSTGHIKALYSSSNSPFQLINLNDFHAGTSSQMSSSRQSGSVVPNNLQAAATALTGQAHAAQATANQAVAASNYQLLPIIQLIPPPQPPLQLARATSSLGPQSGFDTSIGYGSSSNPFSLAATTQQSPQTNYELASANDLPSFDQFQQQQQQRSFPGYESFGGQASSNPYHQMSSRQRQQPPSSFYESLQNSYGAGSSQITSPYDQQQQQFLSPFSRSESGADLVPFDEPVHQSISARNSQLSNNNNYQINQPPGLGQQHTPAKSRRGAPNSGIPGGPNSVGPVHDLDDVEGDHVEYYDADSRDRSPSRASMSSFERNGNRHFVRPPIHHPHTSIIDDGPIMGLSGEPHTHRSSVGSMSSDSSSGSGSSSSGSSTGGSALGPHHNHTQLPPGSIQGIKSQLKKNQHLSSTKMKPRKSSVPPRDDNQVGLDHAGGTIREPKSLQYWKQYQDQFDIM